MDATEEGALWEQHWRGETAAERMLYDLYEPLIRMVVGKSFKTIQSTDPDLFADLKQVGRLALLEAIRNFDPSKGSFSGYANRWIWGKCMHAFDAHNKQCAEASIDEPDEEGEIREVADHSPDHLETLTGSSQRRRASSALDRVRPAIYRDIVRWRAEQGISSRRIARSLGVSRLRVDGIYRKT